MTIHFRMIPARYLTIFLLSLGIIFRCAAGQADAQKSRVLSAVEDARAHGKSVVDLIPPLINENEVPSLAEALLIAKPVIGTLLGSESVVTDWGEIETMYLMRLSPQTPNISALPPLIKTPIFKALTANMADPSDLILFSLDGGSVNVSGVTVRTSPVSHGLIKGQTYLCFMDYFSPERPPTLLWQNRGVFRINSSTQRLSPVFPRELPPALSTVSNSDLKTALASIQASITEK